MRASPRSSTGDVLPDGEQGEFRAVAGNGSGSSRNLETFVSPAQEYAQGYDGVTVRFSVRAGTQDALAGMGIRDSWAVPSAAYPGMPGPRSFSGWTRTSACFKGEGRVLNVGLGRGPALGIFNSAILGCQMVP